MARWKITLEYEGTEFSGWQRQKSGRTVQEVVEHALSTFCQEEIRIMGQGRTDSGVHAEGQVAHVDLPNEIRTEKLLAAMRGLLPRDVAVIDAEIVHKDFHARFDAVSRQYRYQITRRPMPLQRNLYWLVLEELNPDLLHRCATLIEGEHDFKNFSKQDDDQKNTVCTISRSSWDAEPNRLIYRISGNRFLRHLVRRLVGTMQHVATGKLTVDQFEHLLKADSVKRKGHSAPSKGLILESVTY